MTLIALKAGVRWIQYRDKTKSRLGIYRLARRLRELTWDFGACFIVNDHVDIAASVDADGVHLGQDDLPLKEARKILGKDKVIGISTHSLSEAIKAEAEGADYIGFGPVFPTKTKDAGDPKGVQMLCKVRNKVNIPIIAIGGINLDNVDSVLASGADAVAAASAILKGDIYCNAGGLLQKVQRYKKGVN
jgi:thiamine-phosphate pyrophosphorylase